MKRFLGPLTVLLVLASSAGAGPSMHDASAVAYEHLATAMIELRATEERLVEGILNHHFNMARHHLETAIAEGAVQPHGKNAADEITSLANEGNKKVQAVRQKLLKAGHHHHSDAETEEDYLFIDSSERKALLDIANKLARSREGDAANLERRIEELSAAFKKAMKPE